MKIVDFDKVVFSTGRIVETHGGVLGIDNDLEVTGGYDHDFYSEGDGSLTREEQIEMADYMIDLWVKFKARAVDGR